MGVHIHLKLSFRSPCCRPSKIVFISWQIFVDLFGQLTQ